MAPREELQTLLSHIDDRFDNLTHRLDSIERHVIGGSEPERSLLVRLRDVEKDLKQLIRVHNSIRKFFVAAGIAAILSVGAAIKAIAANLPDPTNIPTSTP